MAAGNSSGSMSGTEVEGQCEMDCSGDVCGNFLWTVTSENLFAEGTLEEMSVGETYMNKLTSSKTHFA